MARFPDHFSRDAATYARYRPRYPDSLFEWLAGIAPTHALAWDCGTGSGQAATGLARSFEGVVATDPSLAQLRSAERNERVHYAAMTAESSALAPGSAALVTVAQALHWFRLDEFHAEVRRVLMPNGVLAAWMYGLVRIGPDVDDQVTRFYTQTVGAYWPAERALVDAGYASMGFPFTRIRAPQFSMEADWTLEMFAGYVSTWSAVGRYLDAVGRDPVAPFIEGLSAVWTQGAVRRVRWPLELLVGRV